MDRTRIFLAASALAWLPYGLYCLARPGFLQDAAGVAIASPTGSTELRAMYGGLQAAIGLLALAAFWRPDLRRGTLTTLAVLPAGLFSARLIGAVVDGALSSYTVGALAFEATLTVVATLLLRQHS